MNNYEHLFDDTAIVMDKSVEEKIEFLRKDFFLEYPKATEIIDKLNDLFTYPRTSRMPCYLIVGEPNYGKTGLVTHFCAMNPPTDNVTGDAIKFPVLMIQAPAVPEERRFYPAILRKLNCPFKYSAPVDKLETQVMEVLNRVRPKIIIIDEIHNLIAGALDRQRKFMNVLKNMHNDLQIPFVGVGTKKALLAIRVDDQISSRFRALDLPKWNYGDEFLNFVSSFERAMPLPEASNLDVGAKGKIIFNRSGGVLGKVGAIIREASVYCLKNGKNKITTDILKAIEL